MSDIMYFWFLCQAMQLSVLTLWFDSLLFSKIRLYCEHKRESVTERLIEKTRWLDCLLWFILSVLTCWQCMGYWVAFGVVLLAGALINSPLDTKASLLCLAPAMGYISSVVNYFIPAKESY